MTTGGFNRVSRVVFVRMFLFAAVIGFQDRATIIQLSGPASGFAWAGVGCCRAAELPHRPYLIVLIYPLRQFVLSGAAWPAFIRAEKEKTIFMQVIRAQMNAKEFLLNALQIMILLSTSDVLLLYDTAATKVT